MEYLSIPEAEAIALYCAEEVRRQQDEPLAVGYMYSAWMRAIFEKEEGNPLTIELIEALGRLVHPGWNGRGYRRIPIWVGGREGAPPDELVGRMKRWEERLPDMTPAEAYYEFEVIHPFRDGNGRTGKIIYNWLKDTLRAPVFPPDMFGGISNP